MDLRRLVALAVDHAADQEALVDGPLRLSYGDWTERIHRLAHGLRSLGVDHGDRVAYMLRNTHDHATLFLALQLIGAVAVPINFRAKAAGARYILEHSESRLAVLEDAAIADRLAGELPGVHWIVAADAAPPGTTTLAELSAHRDDSRPDAVVRPDDLSSILYTSGTTGLPKGVAMSHRNAYARFVTYLLKAGPHYGEDVRTFGAAPLYHTVGLQAVFLPTIFLKGTYFCVRDLLGPAPLEVIERERLTFLFGSPTLFHMLVEAAGDRGFDLDSVDHVTFGSAPMPEPLLAALRRTFPRASINEVYGMTEISIPFLTIDTHAPGELHRTADFRVRVVRPGGGPDDVLPPGEVGDLIVDHANDGTFVGYWRDPDRTAERIRDGWFYTGDAFYRDADGAYHITGRLDDMFISGGENIQPVEVEQVLSTHPDVLDVAVIGTPHPRWGEAVTALVVPRSSGLQADDIDEFCRTSDLDDFKRPRRIVFVTEIERNPSGKLVRKELRDRYSEQWETAGDRA
jgi:2-furoate---CoA ligase